MSRLLTTGYETGDIAEAGVSTVNAGGTLTVVSNTPTPRAGNYCLKAACTNTSWNTQYKSFNFGAAKTDVWARAAVFFHGGSSLSPEDTWFQFYDPATSAQCCVTFTSTDGLLRAYTGGKTTLLGTSSTAMTADAWHVLEIRVQITSTTAGIIEVWQDGTRVINFSGDNTSTTTASVQSVAIGHFGNLLNSTVGSYIAFDDIAINDTAGTVNNGRPGDGRVVLLAPNGAGSSTQWVRGGTDTGANYSQVNELPPSMTQYVGSSTVGNRDLYALADLTVSVQSINVVELLTLAQNSDTGGGSIGPTLKSGATVSENAAVSLGTSAGYVTSRWETDPNTSAAWTAAAVNALEAGVTVR